MRSRLAFVLAIIAFSAVASAQSPDGTANLWRDLAVGDSPEVVATKLSSVEGIKKTKVKAAKPGKDAKVDVNYVESGIAILGDRYQVVPIFSGSSLKQVALQTGETCVGGIFDRYEKLRSVLIEKYPDEITYTGGALSESDLIATQLDATASQPTSIGAFFGNDTVVAMVQVQFTRTDPPSTTYVSGELAQSLNNLAWSLYRTRADACNGTGARRANIRLIYLSKDNFEKMSKEIMEKDNAQREDASSKL